MTKATAYKLTERYQLAEQMGDELRQAASRLTAADTTLFAPQATVVDLHTLLAENETAVSTHPIHAHLWPKRPFLHV